MCEIAYVLCASPLSPRSHRTPLLSFSLASEEPKDDRRGALPDLAIRSVALLQFTLRGQKGSAGGGKRAKGVDGALTS